MICPKCRKEQPDSPTCIYCQIVVEKYMKLYPPASLNSEPLPAKKVSDAPGADSDATQKTNDIVAKYNQMKQSMAESEVEDAAAHETKRIVRRKMLLLSIITILITTAVNFLIFHGMARNPTTMLSAANTARTVSSRDSGRVPETSLPAPLQGALNLPPGGTPITSLPPGPNQPSSFADSQPAHSQLAVAPPQGKHLQDTEPGRNSLRRFEVPYRSYGNSEKRVIITVLFNNSVTAPIAIDTGAPGTIISARLAERLGVFNEDQGRLLIQTGGIGGRAPAVRTIIESMEVGGARLEFVPTTVLINPISDSFDGLLGLDFVGNYSVTIDARRRVVAFEEIPTDHERPGGHDRAWWTNNFVEFVNYRDAWQSYSKRLETKHNVSMQTVGNADVKRKEFADQQVREAEKLLDNLNHYASQQAVPTEWRSY